jgi:hypothetical protein
LTRISSNSQTFIHLGLKIRVELDPDPPHPREELFPLGRFVFWGTHEGLSEVAVPAQPDPVRLARACQAKAWLPLRALEGGGLEMAPAADPLPDGFIYATAHAVRQRLGVWHISRPALRQAEAIMRGEAAHYDSFLRGQMCRYVIWGNDGHLIGYRGGHHSLEDAAEEARFYAEQHLPYLKRYAPERLGQGVPQP